MYWNSDHTRAYRVCKLKVDAAVCGHSSAISASFLPSQLLRKRVGAGWPIKGSWDTSIDSHDGDRIHQVSVNLFEASPFGYLWIHPGRQILCQRPSPDTDALSVKLRGKVIGEYLICRANESVSDCDIHSMYDPCETCSAVHSELNWANNCQSKLESRHLDVQHMIPDSMTSWSHNELRRQERASCKATTSCTDL